DRRAWVYHSRVCRRACRAGILQLVAAGRFVALNPSDLFQGGAPRMTVTIYHNPDCGTSRNTLAMIRQSGEEPEIIEYLKYPPSRGRLISLIDEAGLSVRQAIRQKDTPYDALGLADPTLSDAQLLDAMLANPILINRPFVVTPL